ncbi:hypothetical protein Ae201684_018135 [Aphanomyces euteiches]|uniref:Uncharacterized protein n=1 Tax=Aphanomyces euteiches TaxID=100861 RepID=A0A6G0W6S5_9STRA|nr:hypothetical protein Ae201684_018135 [Aphanomyces euteiches]
MGYPISRYFLLIKVNEICANLKLVELAMVGFPDLLKGIPSSSRACTISWRWSLFVSSRKRNFCAGVLVAKPQGIKGRLDGPPHGRTKGRTSWHFKSQ